jgi:hypothetical protein
MPKYRLQGIIMLESTRQEASYDFEDEFDHEPEDIQILFRMINTGEIQIVHELTEEA